MLKKRLLMGTVMAVILLGLILADSWLDGSIRKAPTDKPQATIFMILLVLLAVPTQLEMAGLFRQVGITLFKTVTIPATILLATIFYWAQFMDDPTRFIYYDLLYVISGSILALFAVQALSNSTKGTILNCSGGTFSILYIGLLSSFVLGIRILHGPWALLMFIFTVKSSDIGAYFTGKKFGKHKLAPNISPGKTWEGLAGAVILAALVAFGFSLGFGIMPPLGAIGFGAVFAVLGQLSDLAESMIKRDAALKDSSSGIPGFGGLLDVIDSLLITAPVAFAVFTWLKNG